MDTQVSDINLGSSCTEQISRLETGKLGVNWWIKLHQTDFEVRNRYVRCQRENERSNLLLASMDLIKVEECASDNHGWFLVSIDGILLIGLLGSVR